MYLVTINHFLQLHKELYEREPVIPGGVKQQPAVPQVPHLSYKQQGRILSLAIVDIIIEMLMHSRSYLSTSDIKS